MPPRGWTDGGRDVWDYNDNDENVLLPLNKSWPLTTSTSSAEFDLASSLHLEAPQQHQLSSVTSSGTPHPLHGPSGRDRFSSGATHQQINFDLPQDQHWAQQPASEQGQASITTTPLSVGGDLRIYTDYKDSAESPLTHTAHLSGESLRLAVDKLGSISGSHGSASDQRASYPTTRRVASSERPKKPPTHSTTHSVSLSVGSVPSPGQSQLGSGQRLSKGVPTNSDSRQVSSGGYSLGMEDDGRRGTNGPYTRGGSLVSSTSAFTRVEPDLLQSDFTEDINIVGGSVMRENRGAGKTPGVLRNGDIFESQNQHEKSEGQHQQIKLPTGKGFPIQIGSEIFRLSGASIMSDCYYVQPLDGGHFVRLFADAQFYALPRLISQLFESEIFVEIGGSNFQVPRDIFSSPGDSPNFFSLGFAVFFSSSSEIFPGLDSHGLLRPPSIQPPRVPNRSAAIFAELLHMLRGYPLHIRSKVHRAELIRDCRYFNLKGLEQKLVLNDISYNAERGTSEIVIRLEDIRQSGISFVGDASPSDSSPLGGWVHYSRPFVDETSYEIIVEVGEECTRIDLRTMRAEFCGDAKARITSLFQVVANKMNISIEAPLGLMMAAGGAANQDISPGNTPLSEDRVKIRIERDAHLILDGEEYITDGNEFGTNEFLDQQGSQAPTPIPTSAGLAPPRTPTNWPTSQNRRQSSSTRSPPQKRKRTLGTLDEFGEWMIKKGQWRLRVQPRVESNRGRGGSGGQMEIVLVAVKLDALSGQRGRNAQRGFLT